MGRQRCKTQTIEEGHSDSHICTHGKTSGLMVYIVETIGREKMVILCCKISCMFQAIIQGLRESGVFSTIIASAPSALSKDKFLTSISNGTSPKTVASESLPSQKARIRKEHQATARRILQIEANASALHVAAVPPLSPPGMDDQTLHVAL